MKALEEWYGKKKTFEALIKTLEKQQKVHKLEEEKKIIIDLKKINFPNDDRFVFNKVVGAPI